MIDIRDHGGFFGGKREVPLPIFTRTTTTNLQNNFAIGMGGKMGMSVVGNATTGAGLVINQETQTQHSTIPMNQPRQPYVNERGECFVYEGNIYVRRLDDDYQSYLWTHSLSNDYGQFIIETEDLNGNLLLNFSGTRTVLNRSTGQLGSTYQSPRGTFQSIVFDYQRRCYYLFSGNWVIKYNAARQVEWEVEILSRSGGSGFSISLNSDGSIIALASSTSSSIKYFTVINPNGTIRGEFSINSGGSVWAREYNGVIYINRSSSPPGYIGFYDVKNLDPLPSIPFQRMHPSQWEGVVATYHTSEVDSHLIHERTNDSPNRSRFQFITIHK